MEAVSEPRKSSPNTPTYSNAKKTTADQTPRSSHYTACGNSKASDYVPFAYQLEGAEFLAKRKHALLADKMGLGKTVQAIIAADMVGAGRVCVVCPAVARVNWRREFDRWSVFCPEVKVASYNELALDRALRKDWIQWRPDVLIVDEAHYCKSRDSSRTKALYGPHCHNNGVAGAAKRVWLLTGTPTPNNASELFPHIRALWPELAPNGKTYADWINTYTRYEPGAHGIKFFGNKNLPQLREALNGVMLRRLPEDVIPDMPKVLLSTWALDADAALEEVKRLEITPEVQELAHRLDSGEQVPDSDPHIAAFRRVCGLAKAKPVADLIREELNQLPGEKIIVFVHHRDVLLRIYNELKDFYPVFVRGGDSDKTRQEAIDSFQADPQVRVFIGQIQACSTAVTLTAASRIVFAESSWVPSDNEQAIYRARRIGQKSQILARIAYLDKSIDEAIQNTVARKTRGLLELYGA
jgi:SNF2 family DNA or RNA helicase